VSPRSRGVAGDLSAARDPRPGPVRRPALAFVAAGGTVVEPERFRPLARAAGLILAADSGYDHLRRMGARPDLLLGDLDSISPAALADAHRSNVPIAAFPREKDDTDTALALLEALRRGAGTIVACGAFGGRLDHTLANVLLLASPALRRADIRLLDERQEVRLVRGSLHLRTRAGETVSLLPVGGAVESVTTAGLSYPLVGAALETGPALGVSNVATGEEVEVRIASGSLVLTRIFDGGLDAERYLREELPEEG
jgi:thiamine pyrophosphokinase